jgi:hypothetical protein
MRPFEAYLQTRAVVHGDSAAQLAALRRSGAIA